MTQERLGNENNRNTVIVGTRQKDRRESTSYDEVLYRSKPFSPTAVSSLEARAMLWGLNPVPAKKARVLELGCSMGGNLIAQAIEHPMGTYVGIDLAEQQVDIGNEIIRTIGLDNIRLEAKNIMDIDAEFGTFDYIIVHGIWSWVPDAVKDKIFEICRVNLSKQGIAYISYNTLPGWKRMSQTRDFMLYATRNDTDKSLMERTHKGLGAIKLLQELISNSNTLSKRQSWKLRDIKNLFDHMPYYIAHEYFEDINDPVYVSDFIAMAKEHGLVHVGDTEFTLNCISYMQEDMQKRMEILSEGSFTDKLQILDFYHDTQFRRSMLCHGELEKDLLLHEEFKISTLNRLYYSSNTNLSDWKDSAYLWEQALVNLCRNKSTFTINDVVEEAKALTTEPIDLGEVYPLVLRFLFMDLITAHSEPLHHNPFVEGVSTVPSTLANYVETVVMKGASPYIQLADSFNQTIEGCNEGHVFVMKELATPKTWDALCKKAEQVLEVHRYHLDTGETSPMTIREALEEFMLDLTRMGFLRNE